MTLEDDYATLSVQKLYSRKDGIYMKTYHLSDLPAITSWFAVPLYKGASLPSELEFLKEYLEGLSLEKGKSYHIVQTDPRYPRHILILGLGDKEAMTPQKAGELIGECVRREKEDLCVFTDTLACDHVSIQDAAWEAAYYAEYALYDFTKIRREKEQSPEISFASSQDIAPLCEQARLTASFVNHARDLGNMPNNFMTPEDLAEEASRLAKELNLDCEILTNKELEEIGAGALLGVNRGSSHGARLITLRYEGDPGAPWTALVGKGLTFDAGGYNLKSSSGMNGMKFDMCGASNALCALELIARQKGKANVMAVLGATENKIGPDAYTCNEVLVSLSGKTIEITNTDAEGRLVLCDAITYAQKQGAQKIIDLATLTGACVAALGKNYTGAFTNAPEFLNSLEKASQKTGEKLWQLPLDEYFHEQVKKSTVADMNNCVSGIGAGSSLAAAFLEEFIEEGVQWIHLDIAGSSDFSDGKPYMAKGATGVMVRTLGEMFLS